MRSRYIQNGILKKLSDHKIHPLREIADELEIHRLTVYRHIQDLSLYYPILSQSGCRGGVMLVKEKKSERYVLLTVREIRIIVYALSVVITDDEVLKLLRKLQESAGEED